jgi:cytoskeletal protein RodZ
MEDQFAFLGNKCKAAVAVAMSLGVLLLLPGSLGYGGTIIIQEAFGQFNLPLLEDEEAVEEEDGGGIVVEEEEEDEATTTTTTTTTTPTAPTSPPPTAADVTSTNATLQDLSTYLQADINVDAVRGFIGSTFLPIQGAAGTTALTPSDDSGHFATGRFRVFANESLVRRFIAEMNVAAIDGTSFHNVTITEGSPHRFEVTEGNETAAASSSIVGDIYLDGGTAAPVINSVPMTLTIRGQTLAIEGIDIDETRITDTGQRDIISVFDGESIFGTVTR